MVAFHLVLDAGDEAMLTVHYRVRDPRAGLYFFGPTKDEPDTPLTVWSQGEPVTNRYWIPCLDQPNQRGSSVAMSRRTLESTRTGLTRRE